MRTKVWFYGRPISLHIIFDPRKEGHQKPYLITSGVERVRSLLRAPYAWGLKVTHFNLSCDAFSFILSLFSEGRGKINLYGFE